MFGDNQKQERGEEGWTPFVIRRKTVESARTVDPDGAVEVNPIITVSRHDRAIVQPVAPQSEEEAEATADVDPKASSATDNVKDSEVASIENGTSQTPTQSPMHPSSLPPEPVSPVPAEKVQSLVLAPLMPQTSPGSN